MLQLLYHRGERMDARKGGAALKKLREGLGVSQKELERLTGIKQQNIARLETGQVASPTLETAVLLGRVFGLSADQIAELYEV